MNKFYAVIIYGFVSLMCSVNAEDNACDVLGLDPQCDR